MYSFNDLISKNVLSLYEGELLGCVEKLYFDKKIKKLIALEVLSENETRFILPTKNIYKVGKHAITIKNNQALNLKIEETNLCRFPILSKAYTINGEYLGTIKDVTINSKFITETLSLEDNATIDINLLASCGKNTIIFYDKHQPKKTSTRSTNKPDEYKQESVQTVSILPIENISPTYNENQIKPTVQNPNFLLGRICTKDIFNFNNELLIKSHGVVTKKNLKEINKYGKLRELMLFSK